jgi:hypothetical protein
VNVYYRGRAHVAFKMLARTTKKNQLPVVAKTITQAAESSIWIGRESEKQ